MASNTINLNTYRAKLLSNTYGANNEPIYFNAGVPTILGTIGANNKPVWVNDGVISTLTTIGDTTKPVWVNNGVITEMTAGTTAQFYRGDKSWSNVLTGGLSVRVNGEGYIIVSDGKNYNDDTFRVVLDLNPSSGNHGIYSSGYSNGTTFTSNGKWLIYRDSTGVVTVNGCAQYLTCPNISTETAMETGTRSYKGSGSGWTGSISSMQYAGIFQVCGDFTRGWQIWARRGPGESLHWRNPNSDQTAWLDERIILDSGGNWYKIIFANKNPTKSTLTVTSSTWNVTSGTDLFGISFKDSALTYTPSGGSATASTDSGDWRAWLTCAAASNTVTLNMRIDGTWQASGFIGPLTGNVTGNCSGSSGSCTGNAATATALTSNAGSGEQPIYFTGGKPSATSYALKATVNNSTAGYITYYNADRAVSGTSSIRLADGCLSLFPTSTNYREGLRIHATSNWSDITLCGNDNTGNTGTSANSWFIGNNNGNFYISRNGSPGSTAYLSCVSNAWNFLGSVTTSGGLEIKGHIAGDSSNTGHGLYSGGGYHNAYNNIILQGDATTGSSGIAFVSSKGTATVNQPSDRGFIQFHAYGVTTYTAENTAPTLATSGEANVLVIGVGNDAADTVRLQTPSRTGLLHQVAANAYVIPDTNNTTGSVGGTTTPVYIDGGVIKTCTAYASASVNYATSSGSCSGNAATATKGTKVNCSRVNKNCNEHPGKNIAWVQEFNPSSANLPSSHWYYIYSAQGDDTAYSVHLALGETTSALYYRVCQNNSWPGWSRIVTNSGSWSISVTGSSASCTGNAATATKATQDGSGNTITSYYCTLSTAQTFTGNKTFNSICYFANGTTYYVNKNGDCRLRYLGCGNLDASTSYAIRIGGNAYISGHHYFGNGTTYYINNGGTGNLNGLTVNATTASSSTSTGALIVKGGIGAAGKIYGSQVYNAVWNDYAECREVEIIDPGYCVTETSFGKMIKTTERLQAGCKITSDTFGTCMGETNTAKTPIAVAGRVLVYPYRSREEYKLGAAVCSAPNGTVDIMSRDEIIMYPERIVGTVSEIPTYEVWHGGNQNGENDIKVNGRIWVYVR